MRTNILDSQVVQLAIEPRCLLEINTVAMANREDTDAERCTPA